MTSPKPYVAIARELLPSGHALLEGRFELRSAGLGASRSEILALVAGATAIVSDATVRVDNELLDHAGDALVVVANFAVGVDNIDLEACAERGVLVTNTPDVLSAATAELALALTVAVARGIFEASASLRAGLWERWDPAAYCGPQVSGSSIGVIGMGRIGTEYARMVRPLAGELLYCGSPKPSIERELGARRVGLDELLSRADIVSLHVPATSSNHHLIDARALALLRPHAILINTSRGSVVDGEALASALHEGRLWGAGLDVYEHEPSVSPHLLNAPRAVLLPHIGSATKQARDGMALLVARNVISVLEGHGPLTPVMGHRADPSASGMASP